MKRISLAVAALALVLGVVGPAGAASAKAPGYPLVYMSVHNNLAKLYVLAGTASNELKAANSNGHDCGPAFRPNGKVVAFESNRKTDPYDPNNFEVYSFNLRSSKVTQLTHHTGFDLFPAWSPDGKKIAFSREDDPVNPRSTPIDGVGPSERTMSIWVMNADGSGLRRLTRAAHNTSHLFASWSPDGKKIAFSNGGIYAMNADGSDIRLLSWDGEYPTWSPDGKWIAFDTTRDDPNPAATMSDLYVMRSDGTHQRRLLHDANSFWANWSPDGRHIAYVHAIAPLAAPVLTFVLPTGNGVDTWANPPLTIWELEMDSAHRVTSQRQLTDGTTELFPHYASVHKVG